MQTGPNEMEQAMIAALSPSTWAAFALAVVLSFSSGYAYRWHQDSLKDAKVEATQEATTTTATAAITAIDTQGISRLQAQLSATRQRADNLEQTIKELQNATTTTNPDCVLPIGLRDQINLDLSGRTK
jgi:peptidoglycan hydrolase CwlO-like protein